MSYTILTDDLGNGIPQYYDAAGNPLPLKGDKAPYTQIVDTNGTTLFTSANPGKLTIMGTVTIGSLPVGTNKIGVVDVSSSNQLKGALQDVAAAGTRIQLPNFPCTKVTVIARKGNTGSIFVGGSDVSSTVFGVELIAKDNFIFNVSNTNLIYIDASVSGEGISYVAI